MAVLEGYGMSVDLPAGWTGRIFRAADPEEDDGRATMHVGNWAMPTDDATFGSSIIKAMSTTNQIFMSIAEYTPDVLLPNTASPVPDDPEAVDITDVGGVAFANPGVPILKVPDFDPDTVHGTTSLTGATAVQVPFLVAGRPFVLYAVIADAALLSSSLDAANSVLATLLVSPALVCNFHLVLRTDSIVFNNPLDLGHTPRTGAMNGYGQGQAVLDTGLDRPVVVRTLAGLNVNGTYTADTIADPVKIDARMDVLLGTTSLGFAWRFIMPNFVVPNVAANGPANDPILLPAIVTPANLTEPGTPPNSILAQGSFVTTIASLDSSILVPIDAPPVGAQSRTTLPVVWEGATPGVGKLYLTAYPRPVHTSAAEASAVPLGHASFKIRPGQRRLVRVQLGRRARALFARRRHLRAELRVIVRSGGDDYELRKTVLLTRRQRRSRHG